MADRIIKGWLAEARHCPSPNFNQRPADANINLLVIHNISLPPGEFATGYVEDFFCNRLDPARHPYFATIAHLQVSSHLFISREGGITQFVSFGERAWHAGISSFEGIPNCNDYSIGIELEGCDDVAYTDLQYSALVNVTQLLFKQFPALNSGRIAGHEQIAPGRKTDPGPAFDWVRYYHLLTECRIL